MTNGEWMCANTSLNKRPFSFDRYPMQEQIANDMHENLSCIKPSQVGLTEIQIRKSLTIMRRYENKSLIYTMPNEKMYKRISKTRIQTIVEYDKAFQDVDKMSMDLIPIGSNFMYITGSTEGDATSIDADFLFHDEVDLTPPDMLALFGSRIQGSDIKIRQGFSTPKWDGFGIHKDYSASDQQEYLLKCRSCNHWQIPKFTKENVYIPGGCLDHVEKLDELEESMMDEGLIDLENTVVKCSKCHRRLNLADYDYREWVPTYPNRTHARGYQVRPFSVATLPPKYVITELFRYKRRDNLAGWQNTVLGETATAGNKRLSKPQIEAVMKGEAVQFPPIGTPVHIGIDVGQTCNIVLGTGPSVQEVDIFAYITCSIETLASTVQWIMERATLASGGIDRYPYTPDSNGIRDLTKGIIMPIEYSSGKEIIEEKDSLGLIIAAKANRTMMIDYVANGIRSLNWSLRGYGQEKAIVITHLMDMVREEEGEGAAKWIKLNGTDHYFHAKAFLVAGMLQRGIFEAKSGHEKLADNPFEGGLFSNDFSNMNNCQDLIGHGGYESKPTKIISSW